VHSLRFEGETDDAFRRRAERACRFAKVLVKACLENRCMQDLIADPECPYTVESVKSCPTVRIEYEQAVAIGGIASSIALSSTAISACSSFAGSIYFRRCLWTARRYYYKRRNYGRNVTQERRWDRWNRFEAEF
jgi:hypothetical protein